MIDRVVVEERLRPFKLSDEDHTSDEVRDGKSL